jgi:hypothetical protein
MKQARSIKVKPLGIRQFCAYCGRRILGPAILDQNQMHALKFHKRCYDKKKIEDTYNAEIKAHPEK